MYLARNDILDVIKLLMEKALSVAYRFLAFRPRTVEEVRKKLQTKAEKYLFSEQEIEAVLELLKDQGYLNDLEFIKSADESILTKASYNFKEPAAPSLAAYLEGIDIDIDKIIEDYKELGKKCDFVIVEGAGGLLTPIKDSFSMRDLAKTLNLPLVIVARPNLGTINHTLLTIEAAKNKNIKIAGIIISDYPSGTENIAIKNAPDMIKELSGEKILGILPKIEDLNNNPAVLKDMFLKHINIDFVL